VRGWKNRKEERKEGRKEDKGLGAFLVSW